MDTLLCQNTGFYNRKTKTISLEKVAPTRAQLTVEADTYIVLDGKKYAIGEGIRDIEDRSNNETHRVCTCYDILKHSNNMDTINLMLALPASYYLNKEYRDSYRKFLGNSISGIVDGIEKTVFIRRSEVYMEGAAAYLGYKSTLGNRDVGVIDIGGNTVNAMIFANGKLQKETISTFDLGVIKLERDLIERLNTRFPGWNVQEYELPNILKDDSLAPIVDDLINIYASGIRKNLLERKWNLGRLEIFATGGGACLLEKGLNKYFSKITISQTPIFDNVRGMWLAGQVIFNG